MKVHVVRIRPFANGPLGDAASVDEMQRSCLRDFPDNYVSRLLAQRAGANGEMEIRVRWLGFTSAFDTWEPISNLVEDVPDMVQQFLRDNNGVPACRRMLQNYFP